MALDGCYGDDTDDDGAVAKAAGDGKEPAKAAGNGKAPAASAARGLSLCGVPIKVDPGRRFGVGDVDDNGRIQNNNEFDFFADMSECPQLAPVEWPVSTVTYGTERLVRMIKPPANTPVSHRREVGLRLCVDAVLGLGGVNASLLVLALEDSHPARGRGIKLVLWKVAVLSSLSPYFFNS